MIKVGSIYGPQYSDIDLIEKFLDKDGDWKNLSQATIMYYAVRLVQIRYRIRCRLVSAPVALQSRLLGVIDKIDESLRNINSENVSKVVFSEVSVPDQVKDNPYIVLFRNFIGRGFDAKRAIDVCSDLTGMTEREFEEFLKRNNVTINGDFDTTSQAFLDGMGDARAVDIDLKLSPIVEKAKSKGYKKPEDIAGYVKGYARISNADLGNDDIAKLGLRIDSLVKSESKDRGRFTSEILNDLDKTENDNYILGGF